MKPRAYDDFSILLTSLQTFKAYFSNERVYFKQIFLTSAKIVTEALVLAKCGKGVINDKKYLIF